MYILISLQTMALFYKCTDDWYKALLEDTIPFVSYVSLVCSMILAV